MGSPRANEIVKLLAFIVGLFCMVTCNYDPPPTPSCIFVSFVSDGYWLVALINVIEWGQLNKNTKTFTVDFPNCGGTLTPNACFSPLVNQVWQIGSLSAATL